MHGLGTVTAPVPFTYPFPRPALTVDVALFSAQSERLRVLLIKRGRAPFDGRWALPGGFVDEHEDLPAAALRELVEETGLEAALGPQLGAYGAPGRDPRGHTVSVVYLAWSAAGPVPVQGHDDAVDARWHDARRPPPLAFDHAHVLRDAVLELERRGRRGLEGVLPLLPPRFGVNEALDLLKAVATSEAFTSARVRAALRAHHDVRELTRRGGRLVFRRK